ncbi:MAG: TonB family protein [Candidatus Eiseniibacteriota bacterium]
MSRPADTFRPGLFEEVDRPALYSNAVCLTLGALILLVVWKTPVKPFEELTLDQLPDRVTRLLLNESELAQLTAPEREALPPEAIAQTPEGTTPETTPETSTESEIAPPSDAVGLPGSEPKGGGSGGGGGSGAKGAAVAAGVAQAVAATGALADVDRIVGDFTGVVASTRGSNALRQGAPGSGVERRQGTPGARARSGADLGGVDEILGSAGGSGGRGSAGTAAGLGGGGGGGSGRAQVRIAAPSTVAGSDAGGATRSTGALMAVVQRHAAAVRFCYNRLLQKKPGASGQVIVRLTVAGDGSVSDAAIARSSLNDSELESCVLGQAREWRFAPADEPRFTFDVPFVFTPPTSEG